MAGTLPRCGKLNHFKWVCRSKRRKVPKDDNRHRTVHDRHQDDQDEEMITYNSDMLRSKAFNFQSIKSVTIAKLKTKAARK